jgi:hypothetical protein
MSKKQINELKELSEKIPNHLVIEKCLWVGNVSVDINHIDNDLNKPLDYIDAFKTMCNKLDK